MRIFFTTPYSGKQYFQPFIDEITATLYKNKATVISPENREDYEKSLHEYEANGMQPTRAHYAFIAQGIAEADIVIIEASHESLRLGHEITLSLLHDKPTLVVSQNKNYGDYISHELLTGVRYKTKRELQRTVEKFIKTATTHLSPQANQNIQPTVEGAVDSLRLTTYATMRQHALQDDGEFGNFADLAEHDPEKAHRRIQGALGHIPVEKPWSTLASIYNEDTPDFLFVGAMQFIQRILGDHGIKKNDHIVDAFTHGGIIARHLAQAGYTNISSYSSSREMLAQTYQLCANNPEIKILEASPPTLQLPYPAKAIVWINFTTNFALTKKDLERQLQNQLSNISADGCFIFDVRTITGWKAYLFRERVATFATQNFQRISLNIPDDNAELIHIDTFIRIKQNNALWGKWHREQLTNRMWSLDEMKTVVGKLKHCKLEAIYDDDFSPITNDREPGLAYFVLKKQ